MADKDLGENNGGAEDGRQFNPEQEDNNSIGGDFSYFPHLQQMIESQNGGGQGGGGKGEDSSVRVTGRRVGDAGNQKMSNSKQRSLLKTTKKRAGKVAQKDPFVKNRIFPSSVKSKMDNPKVREQYKDFTNKQHDKSRIYKKIQQSNDLKKAQKGEEELKKEDQKQAEVGKMLKTSMLEEDLKRALQGPSGWAKNLKGCFSSAMICLTVIGGSVLGVILWAVL